MNNRLTDFKFDSEEEVVTRIIKSLHATIDREFPDAPPAPPKYSMTVFQNDEDTRNETLVSIKEKTKSEAVFIKSPSKLKQRLHLVFLIVILLALVFLWLLQMAEA